jgi:hypothetical protein
MVATANQAAMPTAATKTDAARSARRGDRTKRRSCAGDSFGKGEVGIELRRPGGHKQSVRRVFNLSTQALEGE